MRLHWIIGFLLLYTNFVFAVQNKTVSILPTIKPPHLLPVNGETTAQYWITNHLPETVTLSFLSMKGVKQDTSGLTACSASFTLETGQSCYLNLKIRGEKLGEKLSHGPVVCQTKAINSLKINRKFCYAPTAQDQLNLRIVAPKKALITTTPAVLTVHAHSITPDKLVITNHSTVITASDVKAHLPEKVKGIIQDASDCKQIPPKASCKLFFSAANGEPIAPILISIQGNNTVNATVRMMVKLPYIEKIKGKNNLLNMNKLKDKEK